MKLNIISLLLVVIFATGLGAVSVAAIFYPLFLSWPLLRKLNKQGKLTRFPYGQIFIPPIIWIVLTFLGFLLVRALASKYIVWFWAVYGFMALMVISKTKSQQNIDEFYENNKDIIKS